MSFQLRKFLATASIVILLTYPVWATYVQPELSKFPLDRVLTNLANQAAAKPKDAKLKLNLARAYAMAYATKADEIQMKGDAIWYGFEPRNVPFTNKPITG